MDAGAGNRLGVAEGLEALAAVLLAQGETRQAVLYWATMHTALSTPLSPREQQSYEYRLAHARSEQAIAHVLEELDRANIPDAQ